MFQSASEQLNSVRIGTIQYVAPDEIRATLDAEAPESVALNTGEPRPFPRVNGYLLIPVDADHLVGQVEWITAEQTASSPERGRRDAHLVDLPNSLRRLRINPLGMLRRSSTNNEYFFQRGAEALPSVGASVILPTEWQLRAIIESGEQRHVKIGTSPLAGDAVVAVDPNKLFGRHLAVLGNTGSGKSCSVAGLIRWSLEQSKIPCVNRPNARFIILDPNGEYSSAFDKTGATKSNLFKVNPEGCEVRQLRVPVWFWDSAEWTSFTQASPGTQRPTLLQALRFSRDGQTRPTESPDHGIRRFLRTIVATILIERDRGTPWGAYPRPKDFYEKLKKWKSSIENDLGDLEGERLTKLRDFAEMLNTLCQAREGRYPHYDFEREDVDDLIRKASEAHSAFGGVMSDVIPPDIDAPIPFDGESLLRNVEATAEMLNVSAYVETLLIRMRALLTDSRMKPILGSYPDVTLSQWLEDYIGKDDDESACVTVIDMSLVPSEVVHIVTAVVARMVFEALQRYVKLNGVSLPTVLVMEEAHTFVKRYRDDVENADTAKICCQVFERIAREGRKFGLGLVLSSQRPSELSPTVLSQCNTFLLHRISNDRDQELISRLVPDNLRGMLRELPSLPTQNAVLLGWATELPLLVKMNELPKDHQPRSDDPEFWKVWIGESKREVDWESIADNWQGISSETGVGTESETNEQNETTEAMQQDIEDDDLPR